jgi:hypothetical protein
MAFSMGVLFLNTPGGTNLINSHYYNTSRHPQLARERPSRPIFIIVLIISNHLLGLMTHFKDLMMMFHTKREISPFTILNRKQTLYLPSE